MKDKKKVGEFELVPEEDWVNCIEEFNNHLPQSLPYNYALQNYSKYLKDKKGENLNVYKASIGKSKWIYVFQPHKRVYNCYQVFTNCRDVDERYLKCLLDDRLIDWSKSQLFYALEKKLWDCFTNMLKFDKNWETFYQHECDHYWISKEKAETFDIRCPEGFVVREIDEEFTEFINSHWEHKYKGSEGFIGELLKTFGGFGVFCKATNNLVSWILINQYSELKMLQTLEGYQRRGFAKILVKQSCKSLAGKGVHPHAFVLVSNEKSRQIFENLGFEKASKNYFVRIGKLPQITNS